MVDAALFSSAESDWNTPDWLMEFLSDRFGPFGLDAAAAPGKQKAEKYFALDCQGDENCAQNGLVRDWQSSTGITFLNPPYGKEIGLWIARAGEQAWKWKAKVVVLVPARTDTKWWHNWALMANEVYFFRGRIPFQRASGKSVGAPFPSALLVFNGKDTLGGTRMSMGTTFGTIDLRLVRREVRGEERMGDKKTERVSERTPRQEFLRRKAHEARHLCCALLHCFEPPKYPGGVCDLHEQEIGGEGGQ